MASKQDRTKRKIKSDLNKTIGTYRTIDLDIITARIMASMNLTRTAAVAILRNPDYLNPAYFEDTVTYRAAKWWYHMDLEIFMPMTSKHINESPSILGKSTDWIYVCTAIYKDKLEWGDYFGK